MKSWQTTELLEQVRESEAPWLEFLRVADLSAGLYHLGAGADDRQQPHTEDEIYVVMAGRARFEAGSGTTEVSTGSVLYVPAGEPHRFRDIREDLTVLVLFAPPEYSRASPGDPSALP